MPAKEKFDVYQEITDRIVAAIDTAGEFRLPWFKSTGGSFAIPVNIASGKPYSGVNILSLWLSAQASDYPSHLWGTYRQWQEHGAQVRRGEKSSLIVFYKRLDIEQINEETGETESAERLIARASHVFNAAQVDNFKAGVAATLPETPAFDPISRAEQFAKATGAKIEEGGDEACYIPALDVIRMPERCRFIGTDTSTPAEAFYSTLCHELVHWSGSKSRLDRRLSNRFRIEAYAVEELVAELGAAFLCSELAITPEPRADHAQYVAHWLTILKGDKRAIFTAASKASQAANWLLAHEQGAP
ncbi:ArdC family protein [Mesorhizobium sp. CN2-181]|uniref:ArdC family protein n=1 Tax=Mesorhizobium yinganensis TaxID=3157707 RepID=UPI0032B72908